MIAPATVAPFELYGRVRDWATRLRELATCADALTPAETRLLSALEPIWRAEPETVAGLRRFGEAITDVRPSDYEDPATASAAPLRGELRRLLARGDPALWVDEPRLLGGFGWGGRVALYNADTLRFFRAISLLQDAGVLAEMREAATRPTVWEIGGGWGGFAHQIKTVCPNVTYLATGHPELLLLSAVYVMTLFPAARVRFYDPAAPDAFWADWDTVDFAFAPEYAVTASWPVAVDVTVDLQMLERMTPARIAAHVRRAYDSGCRYILSVCPSTDGDAAVPPVVARWYWDHPMSTLNYLRRRLSLRATSDGPERTFLLAWRRRHA